MEWVEELLLVSHLKLQRYCRPRRDDLYLFKVMLCFPWQNEREDSMSHICRFEHRSLQFKRFQKFCNFPIVLVGVTSNRLDILRRRLRRTDLCDQVTHLTPDPPLWFYAADSIIRLARVFWALSRCRVDLKVYYDGVRNLDSLCCLYRNR
jgi:hypothetical protein